MQIYKPWGWSLQSLKMKNNSWTNCRSCAHKVCTQNAFWCWKVRFQKQKKKKKKMGGKKFYDDNIYRSWERSLQSFSEWFLKTVDCVAHASLLLLCVYLCVGGGRGDYGRTEVQMYGTTESQMSPRCFSKRRVTTRQWHGLSSYLFQLKSYSYWSKQLWLHTCCQIH